MRLLTPKTWSNVENFFSLIFLLINEVTRTNDPLQLTSVKQQNFERRKNNPKLVTLARSTLFDFQLDTYRKYRFGEAFFFFFSSLLHSTAIVSAFRRITEVTRAKQN